MRRPHRPITTQVLEVRKDGLSLFPGNVSDDLNPLEQVGSFKRVQTSKRKSTFRLHQDLFSIESRTATSNN
ncbi:hypothetical protein VDG1235_1651 [Verrucomicrobiia bacterium DG1235]|nr:hypothetical protein VDG1235_1651 [Verrucomicrobiae bacterium DG1235]